MEIGASILNPTTLKSMIGEWLREDVPNFDIGGGVVGANEVSATLLAKSHLVFSGIPFATALLESLNCCVKWYVAEGAILEGSNENRVPIAEVRGPANAVLQAERTVLEVLSRSSACATETHRCVRASLSRNPQWKGRVACTRKTTPGTFREVEKYGVLVGGGDPHRYCLSSMVMLKDNHIDIAGCITKAVQKARRLGGFSLMIEVECRSVRDAMEACAAGANVVMLDNFSPKEVRAAVPVIRREHPHVVVECSGGITLNTVADFCVDGVDVVSIGKLTHGVPAVDISMTVKTASHL